nr:MAG: hypothetical protein 2 [Leviviridae sp.]
MALTDPYVVTIGGVAQSLVKVTTGENSAGYRSADGFNDMQVSHTYGRRIVHRTRFHNSKMGTDPISPALNRPFDMAVSFSVNVPDVGYTAAEAKAVVDGYLATLTASSGAIIAKLLGGES